MVVLIKNAPDASGFADVQLSGLLLFPATRRARVVIEPVVAKRAGSLFYLAATRRKLKIRTWPIVSTDFCIRITGGGGDGGRRGSHNRRQCGAWTGYRWTGANKSQTPSSFFFYFLRYSCAISARAMLRKINSEAIIPAPISGLCFSGRIAPLSRFRSLRSCRSLFGHVIFLFLSLRYRAFIFCLINSNANSRDKLPLSGTACSVRRPSKDS